MKVSPCNLNFHTLVWYFQFIAVYNPCKWMLNPADVFFYIHRLLYCLILHGYTLSYTMPTCVGRSDLMTSGHHPVKKKYIYIYIHQYFEFNMSNWYQKTTTPGYVIIIKMPNFKARKTTPSITRLLAKSKSYPIFMIQGSVSWRNVR